MFVADSILICLIYTIKHRNLNQQIRMLKTPYICIYLYEYLTQETLTFILCLQFLFFLQEGFGHGTVPHPQQMGVSTIFHLNIKSLLIGYQTNITFVCGGVMVRSYGTIAWKRSKMSLF
jgi:hypothetical protein